VLAMPPAWLRATVAPPPELAKGQGDGTGARIIGAGVSALPTSVVDAPLSAIRGKCLAGLGMLEIAQGEFDTFDSAARFSGSRRKRAGLYEIGADDRKEPAATHAGGMRPRACCRETLAQSRRCRTAESEGYGVAF